MSRYVRPLTVAVAAVAVLGAAGAATAQTIAAPSHPAKTQKAAKAKAAATRGWTIHKTLSSVGDFWDTAASSWGNAWAVGEGSSSSTGLAWRWNGKTWGAVKLPSGTRSVGEVRTSGTGNTWLLSKDSAKKPLLLRWNNGKWSTPGATHAAGVFHIAAAGANQLWATGDGFLRHYTGSSWTDKKLPDGVQVNRIAVNHYNDVWAVGQKGAGSDGQPFAMHWNGSSWTTTAVPTYPSDGGDWGGSTLDGVAFIGANDVYAGGNSYVGEDVSKALLVHWNGTKWSKVSLPKAVTDSWMGGVGVTPVGGGGIWYAWAHRHFLRRTPSGTTTDYTLPAKTLPYVRAVAHIPGSNTTLAVGSTSSAASHPYIALGH